MGLQIAQRFERVQKDTEVGYNQLTHIHIPLLVH